MELELGLAPPNARHLVGHHLDGGAAGCRKRGFGEAFGEEEKEKPAAATTLPLFDDGSNNSSISSSSSSSSDCRKKKEKPVVGWPPVSSARRACGGGARHVKVKKEGVGIGRKVDLSLHASYDELLATLRRMFPSAAATTTTYADEKEIASDRDHGVVVTYEDADGDWMLVGDVPWDDFARSAKRLKILL